MKKIIFLFLFSSAVYSQQDTQFVNYMFNQEAYNPAYSGTLEYARINASSRTQWVGLEGAPKTNTLTFSLPYNNLGFGTTIINDKIGVNNQTYFSLNVSYKAQLNYNTYLVAGLNPSITNLNINNSDLFIFDNTENEFAQNYKATKFNIGAGTFLYSDNYYIGFSIPRILEQVIIDDNISLNKSEITQYLTAGYIHRLSPDFKIKPAGLLKYNFNSPLQYDVSINTLYRDVLNLGVNYKNNNTVSTIVGFQLKNVFIAYAYDFENNDLIKNTSGSHEIFLRFDFLPRDKKLVTPRYF